MTVSAIRQALVEHLGQVLTPDVARALEIAALSFPDQSHDPAKFGQATCGTVTLQAERLADVIPELHVLHEAHWAETERHRHGLALDLDYDAMLADERAGTLVQFTARKAGQLVGNLRVYIRSSRHTQTRFAFEDTLYLLPEHRGGRTAIRLIEFAERAMASIGVFEFRATAKLLNRTADLMQHLGYKPVATELVKFLEIPS